MSGITSLIQKRIQVIVFLIPFFTLALLVRLFYWQIIRGPELAARAARQHQTTTLLKAKRGDITDSEGALLAGTKNLFHLYVYKPQLQVSPIELVESLVAIIKPDPESSNEGDLRGYFRDRLDLASNWISLKHYLTPEEKEAIEKLNIKGLGFEDEYVRFYPEASMSAHVLGFVGQDLAGEEQGYFGLEGSFDRKLRGRSGKVRTETDAKGNPILVGDYQFLRSVEGQAIRTTIDKKIQFLVENALKRGLEKYQASDGNVIVMESSTGKVRAMASYPNYDPAKYSKFDQRLYKNPNISALFEPGSIFKVLVMAAAINEKVVDPDTICDICNRPLTIGKYTIKTWDEVYRPNTTMTDVIINSDNIGMAFAAFSLGKEKFADYLSRLGFGKKTDIELQEEVAGQVKTADELGEVDLATQSFGQGIAVTPIQMISAVNTLANKGYYLPPTIIESSVIQPATAVFSQEAVSDIVTIMIQAVEKGEAKWAKPKNLTVAGKTGTAQVPIEGHYDPEKTIASFIGFFPADNPRYTMLVTLREPQTSPWGSETAAPLWFSIAKSLLL